MAYGDSGEGVRQLQIFLKAQGPEIYPEGLITGYFGSLTQKAVQRFQEKYGIAKATGTLEGIVYEEIRYEGYGIGGAAIIVDTMTDNRVRTVAEVRHAFSKFGGNLGTDGSVAFMFKHCGQLIFAPGTDEDKLMEAALEAGADDVIVDDDGAIEVLTSPAEFEAVKNALEAANFKAEVAEVTMRADNTVQVTGEDAVKMQKLLDALEDMDDTQEVYHNAEMSE